MPPQPLEGVHNAITGYIPSGQEGGPRLNTISLGVLIDFIIQRTYHELSVLAELLPRKSDMERKIEIYNFAARTRQVFIRLLALVKWANSASKVDKSAHIMSFLDKQNMLFIETADRLARISRETLVRARLPNFHIPAAVEILTTGKYARLPSCIRERIVPTEPITMGEKNQTLLRLNQVIQHRLVNGNLLPQMKRFKINGGRVTFQVDNEFEVSLTLMGDGGGVPWRLLDIDILVEDKDTGDGKALVHRLQINYIHQLIQARLAESPNALMEVYNCLHYFCQSLQLEVLYTQTLRLMIDRLDDNIHVDEYVPGVKLTVAYWRELTSKDPKSELGYRLTIQSDPTETARPLAVIHVPSIGAKESSEVADRAVRSENLSMERLIVHTIYIRSVSRLTDLKDEFEAFLKDVEFHLQGTPVILTVPVLNPCLRAEQIHITVDTHTGMLKSHVPKHVDCPIMNDFQLYLNSDRSKLPALISELRYWITFKRCEKTLQHLPACAVENFSFVNAPDIPLLKCGRQRIFVRLYRYPEVIIILHIKEKKSSPSEMTYFFHLAYVKSVSGNQETVDGQPSNDFPKIHTKLEKLLEYDTFVLTHGPETQVDGNFNLSNTVDDLNNQHYNTCKELVPHKRKSNLPDNGPSSKHQKTIYPAYFIPELAHVVAMCDEKIPFLALAREFSNRKIPHSGVRVESNATSLVLKLLTLPIPGMDSDSGKKKLPKVEEHVWNDLMKRLLSISVRSQMNKNNQLRHWVVELVFFSTPLQSSHHKEQGNRRTVNLTYEQCSSNYGQTIDDLLRDWTQIVYLYNLIYDFAKQYNSEKYNLQSMVSIKSYCYTNLFVGYGPNKAVTSHIYWTSDHKEFRMVSMGGVSAINAHSMMREQLQSHLNRHYNLSQIIQILHETYQPLSSIAKLPIIPQLGIQRPHFPILSFCVVAQSPTMLRLCYQSMYVLEIGFKSGGLVSIRDGAYSRFDCSNVIQEVTPTQQLKGFLSKYVDENAVCGRRAQNEDDNPPSPITMEDPMGTGTSTITGSVSGNSTGGSSPFLGGMRGPQSPRDGGLRFAPPITPPCSSNPHTPASPHPIAQNHPNFNMTSPPAPHMPHPSPSGLMPSSPLNPQPSPMAHSPGPSSLSYMQNHNDSSPFTAMSPATSNWPGSPSMPRPSPRPGQSPDHKSQAQTTTAHMSRVLPARSWAGAVPTLLTHEALDLMCRTCPHPNKDITAMEVSPLERFLGCGYMRRQLQRNIQTDDALTPLNSSEPGVVLFKVDNLQAQAALNQQHMQSLHLKLTHLPVPPTSDGKPPLLSNPEDLQILEQFFETRVVVPPYRPNSMYGFTRALNCTPKVLKDFIQIMKLEMFPELGQCMKWAVQFCMRVPPSAAPIVPVGNPGVLIWRNKILFFLQITRIPYPGMDWKDSPSLVLPMIYDIQSNITQLAERREQVHSQSTNAVSTQLRRFVEYSSQSYDCSLYPAVRDMLINLTLPNDAPPPPSAMTVNQIVPSPAPMGSSPSPMMHSPMPQMGQVGQMQQGYAMGSNQGPN